LLNSQDRLGVSDLFKFSAEQKIFDIAGLKVGGQPGQLPTVMVGSIFYHKDKVVTDPKTGTFEKNRAEEILKAEEEMSAKTGNPRMVDVCASWPEAFPKEIEFVADMISGPFTIDGTTAEVRLAGAKYVCQAGLSNRVVYNSITPDVREDEVSAIREAKIKSALLLALNATTPTSAGRLAVIDKLLDKARTAGIEKMLIDTTVLDLPDPGPAGKTAYLVKEKYGLPCGCGAHNAVDMWHRRKKLDPDAHLAASVVANTLPIVMGSSFMLYGPIQSASRIYVPVAVADAYIAYTMMQEYSCRPLTNTHPIFKIFRT
jgi:tetrahydromethanopterin S-methyltransferase subunit H